MTLQIEQASHFTMNLTREMVDPAIYTNNDNEDCTR